MNPNYNPQTKHNPQKDKWDGFVYETTIYGLFEPLHRYDVEDMRSLLSALTRGGKPKILYIEYDYGEEGEHFVKLVDPEFKAFLEKKGVTSPTSEVDNVDEDDVKEFLKQRKALSKYIVEIENGEDAATVVAYI
jgi:hypothetical protein